MFEGVNHVHCIGIGGIGVSALAKWFSHRGVTVSGSDKQPSLITRELEALGVVVVIGSSELPPGTELVVYSPAVPETDPERQAAAARGVRQLSYPQALGELSRSYSTIAVSGTNGKSTTTAMLGLILEAAGYDPTVIVGSRVPGFAQGNFRPGAGRFLVVEACEYREHMLDLSPEMIVLTNIEADHLDYYRDLGHIRDAFQKFVDKLQGKGMVVTNADDAMSRTLQMDRRVTFGLTDADVQGANRQLHAGAQSIRVHQKQPSVDLGELRLSVPGVFNVMNALAAAAAALELGVPFETIQLTLRDFGGIWRRFERVGVMNGADVISDYGHHPTAIRGTIQAAHEFFPGRRIVLCFQPHQHERTKTLFGDFVEALQGADVVIVPEIYGVLGRTDDNTISSRDLVDAVRQRQPSFWISFAADLSDAERQLRAAIQPNDVVIIQGAGDVDAVARSLV